MIRGLLLLLPFILPVGCKGVEEPPQPSVTVVFATMEHCVPCQRAKPFVARIEQSGRATVVRIGSDEAVDKWGVTRFPTFIVIEDGEVQYKGGNVNIVLKGLNLL